MAINDGLLKVEHLDYDIGNSSINTSHPTSYSSDLPTSDNYSQLFKAEVPRGADLAELPSGDSRSVDMNGLPHSMFSDYHLFRLKTVNNENYPKTNIESKAFRESLYKNMSIMDLIDNPKGSSIFKAEDFLYIERVKKLPINRMVTLRRYTHPITDDIFSIQEKYDEPDIGRMITFSDQEMNKELMTFSMGMKWREITSEMQQMQMHGAQAGVSGYMRSAMKYIDPTFGQDQIRGDTALSFNPMHDSNKTYGPVDSIVNNHIRDLGLDFSQDIKLTFNYKMRSINGINGKSAFLDLLSNILLCCTNDAKFWGGSRFWLGRRPTKYMKNLKFLSPTSFNDFLNKAHVEFKGFLGKGSGDTKKDALNLLKTVANNVFNMGFGALLDKIGRPSIPFSNSLLTNNPIGMWHVTIGNPHNPRMCVGNLILTGTVVTFGEQLGYDDFPEDITVECTLKHAMPRGRAEIEQMFTAGKGRMYWKPADMFAKNNKSKSTKETPSKASDYIGTNITKFGGFDKESVLRNAESVWSFDQISKEEQEKLDKFESRK